MASGRRPLAEDREEEDVEEEEEEEEPEAEEDEEDEEEDGLGRHRSAARKRGKAAAFIDDVADEDDEEDEEASRRQKRSRFIDDIAEVDDDDEDDELEEEGLDDLIDDAGEHVHDAADMIAMRRQMREAEMQAAKDEEMNPEELQAYLKDRYGGQSHYPGTGGAGTEDFGAVAQQALLPKPSDPKLWVVRCAEGAEREVVVCLLQKCYDLAQKGRSLLIKSAFCQDHLKGYLYVEAVKEAHVAEAVRGMRAVFNSKKPRMVPLGEMTAAVAVQVTAARGVDVGSWVRAKAGLYKGDLAQVVDLDASGARATLRLVPRLDLAALSARRPEDARANFGRAPRVRPAAKAFSPDEARQYKTLDVLTQRDRTTGQLVHVLNGSQRFSEGYLIKSVAVKGLALEDGLPPLDDLQRFQAAAQGGGGGGGGGAGDRAGAADLAGLVQSLTTEGEGQGGAAPTRFAKGDLVLVVQGDLAGIRGRVEAFGEDGLLMVAPTDSKLPGFTELIGLHPREIQKHFESGSHVKVEHGQHMGETGMVVTVTGPIATIFTDVSRQEIRVFVKDLVQAVAVTSSVDTIGGYELHDLVALDATTVGVIVGVERDACRVLTNQGRPEKPDVRVALLPDLKRKLNNRKAGAQDGARNEVAVGDIVEVVDGPLRGKNGTVRYVVRGFLFLQSRQIPEHGGYVCVQARHCRVRGGRKPVSTSNPLATPARLGPGGPGGGVMASPARQSGGGPPGWGGTPGGGSAPGAYAGRVSTGADRLLEGRVITIRQGPHRGMRGRVVSSTPAHLRMELEAQMKTVTVSRAHVALEDGGVRGGGDGGGGAGGFYPGATPAHHGVGATPAHWSSVGATPLHPSATPSREALTKTPAYDPAWAATPAHPGFAAPSPYHLPGSPGRGPTPGMRYHIDTPGSGHLAPTPGSYLPTPGMAPSPFSPAPALTPGLAATPGLSYEAVPAADYGAAPRALGGAAVAAEGADAARGDALHWVGVEVLLPGGEARGAVHEVDAAGLLARVAPGRQGDGGAWGYEGAEASVEVPVRDLQAVTPARTDTVKLLRGDLAGRVGELVGTDGGDGIVKLGPEIKIWELAHVGRVVLPAA
ncbi:hypothetical protein ACKKBG_A02530 [Auxenochlorella protothecoides x Auxenochlorella symbiontica]